MGEKTTAKGRCQHDFECWKSRCMSVHSRHTSWHSRQKKLKTKLIWEDKMEYLHARKHQKVSEIECIGYFWRPCYGMRLKIGGLVESFCKEASSSLPTPMELGNTPHHHLYGFLTLLLQWEKDRRFSFCTGSGFQTLGPGLRLWTQRPKTWMQEDWDRWPTKDWGM